MKSIHPNVLAGGATILCACTLPLFSYSLTGSGGYYSHRWAYYLGIGLVTIGFVLSIASLNRARKTTIKKWLPIIALVVSLLSLGNCGLTAFTRFCYIAHCF